MENIYVIHPTNFDYKNQLYSPFKNSLINEKYKLILPHETTEVNSKKIIKKCKLIIAEVSIPSTGSGIELGWVNNYNIPIICIYKKDIKYLIH